MSAEILTTPRRELVSKSLNLVLQMLGRGRATICLAERERWAFLYPGLYCLGLNELIESDGLVGERVARNRLHYPPALGAREERDLHLQRRARKSLGLHTSAGSTAARKRRTKDRGQVERAEQKTGKSWVPRRPSPEKGASKLRFQWRGAPAWIRLRDGTRS